MAEAFLTAHQLLAERHGLLCALAESVEQAQAAVMAAAKLDAHTARQQELCRRLRELGKFSADGGRTGVEDELASQVQGVARRLRELNRKYGALLRRGRRTLDIFCRVLANGGPTYPAPKRSAK